MAVKQADPNPIIADRGQKIHKSAKGNASQFFVAGELCRRGYYAVVTLGNTPNTDILCSNLEGTRFVHIQVKTFTPGASRCIVGKKAEMPYGDNFFWVLAGIPEPPSPGFEYYIIPSKDMAKNVEYGAKKWLKEKGKHGEDHKDSGVRIVQFDPDKHGYVWNINEAKEDKTKEDFRNRWDLIASKLHL
jgi:hypothetical protein